MGLMKRRTRKRPYKAHKFGQRLGEVLGRLGDGGYVKVLTPDGLAMHRIVDLTETIEEDVIVWLEPTPCWRKRATALVAPVPVPPLPEAEG